MIAATSIGAWLLLGGLLVGCVSPSLRAGADDPARVTDSINLSGFPPEYKRGFSAGCANANSASRRPPRRTKANASFVQGWLDGVDYCSPRAAR